jgi:tight adherence protein C
MATEVLLALVGVFVLVATGVAAGTSWWITAHSPEHRRLTALDRPASSGLIAPTMLATGSGPTLPWARWVPPNPKKMSRVQRRLALAGLRTPRAAVVFSVAEVVLPVVLAGVILLAFGFPQGVFTALAAGALGYVTPGLYVSRKTTLRKKAIANALPDGLDLLTVCVEAGSGLDQALAKAGEELRVSHPALAEEFRAITTEIRAGKPRLEAFGAFAARTGLDEVKALVSMLTQTDRFGTSIGQALRVQSETSRTKRRQAAEERAAKVGVKLVFPLVLCLFPALYVVCFGPVVVHIYRVFFETT